MKKEEICGCDLCGNMLYEGEPLAEHITMRSESDRIVDHRISDIALAHRSCAARDNKARGEAFWEFGA